MYVMLMFLGDVLWDMGMSWWFFMGHTVFYGWKIWFYDVLWGYHWYFMGHATVPSTNRAHADLQPGCNNSWSTQQRKNGPPKPMGIRGLTCYIHLLVGGFNPSEKYEFVSWDDNYSQLIWKVITMFQSPTSLSAHLWASTYLFWLESPGTILQSLLLSNWTNPYPIR